MHTIPVSRIELDPSRIASISGAIAVHVGLVLLLIAPTSLPPARAPTITVTAEFLPKRVPPLPPKPRPDKPIRVEVSHATPAPDRQPPREATHVTTEPVLPTTDPGDLPVVVPQGGESIGLPVLPPDDGKPLAGAHLEYADAPAPAYPRDAVAANETGTVLLEVLVDVDGRPLEVRVVTSSGSRSLDLAARRQVLAKWRFRPATRNGVAVQAIGRIPVVFELN